MPVALARQPNKLLTSTSYTFYLRCSSGSQYRR